MSQAFEPGASIDELVRKGVLRPHPQNLTSYSDICGHQQKAFAAIHRGKTALVAIGTGSGKPECFLYPIH